LKGEFFSTQFWNETTDEKNGIMKRSTGFPEDLVHWILSGPHFFVGTPLNKTPRARCTEKGHYDCIDLTNIPETYIPRTNYVPVTDILPNGEEDLGKYYHKIPRVPWKENGESEGKPVTKFFRLANRRMVDPSVERSFISAVFPIGVAHIDSVFSTVFKDSLNLCNFAGASQSIVYDFYLRTTGKSDLRGSTLENFPFIENNQPRLLRFLLLNCITKHYEHLWSKLFSSAFIEDSWTSNNPRLNNYHFKNLSNRWTWETPLRTDFSRRQALIEVDVLVARDLGMTLEELQTIFRIRFPVMKKYEKQTYYDQTGRVVYTISQGLYGVGFPRKGNKQQGTIGWEDICDMSSGTVSRTVIDDTLPGGPVEREIIYYAPFDRCDREADYATAWAEFERRESL